MKKYFIALALGFMGLIVKASDDSLLVQDHRIMKVYNYLTMANHPENSVWKLKILPLTSMNSRILTYDGTPIIISHEKKIKTNLSYQIEMKAILESTDGMVHTQWDTFTNTNQTTSYAGKEYYSSRTIGNASVAAELRYYYNMNRKMHRKHGVSNFSANYFALRLSRNVLQTGTDANQVEYQSDDFITDQSMHPFYDNHVATYYGIQRRFLHYFFADVQLGVAYRYSGSNRRPQFKLIYEDLQGITHIKTEKATRVVPLMNFRIGFAF